MSEYSGFILVNRKTLGPFYQMSVTGCQENSGVGLQKFLCIQKCIYIYICVFSSWVLKHNISAVLRAVHFTLVGETGVSGENYRPVQITDKLNHNFSYDRY